jgi:DNA-binding LacI/PurR family transcriptional regulator
MAKPTRSRMGRTPTLEDVARSAGVSRALVSIVIRGVPGASPETRARVMAVADQLGYRPDVRARLLARTSSRLLGVTFRVGALHHDDLIPSIYAAAEAAGYEVILSGKTIAHDDRQAVNALLGYRCDAILMLGPDLSEAELNDIAASIPVVVVGRRLVHRTDTVDVVRTHEDAGMGMAVEHLVRLGHTRITHVDGGPGTMASDRRRGYREQMTRLGLRSEIRIVRGGETTEAGHRATAATLDTEPLPTAVICYNDECAWGLIRVAAERGLAIPRDLSVLGYDGSPLARLAPRQLTTVHQDSDALGRRSVEHAIARIEDGAPVTDVVLTPSFVPGETTGPPPDD